MTEKEGPTIEERFDQVQQATADEQADPARIEQDAALQELALVKRKLAEKEHQLAEAEGKANRLRMVLDGANQYVNEKERENAELRGALTKSIEQAQTDALTGVLNRFGFEREATAMLSRAMENAVHPPNKEEQRATAPERVGEELSILMIDADFFKKINDTYGHAAGDVALKALASSLRGTVRGLDRIGRYGGEEFTVAISTKTPGERLLVAERIRKRVQQAVVEYNGQRIPLTVSVGVAKFDPARHIIPADLAWTKQGLTPEEREQEERTMRKTVLNRVIQDADTAVYAAKQRGRNQVIVSEVLQEEEARKKGTPAF